MAGGLKPAGGTFYAPQAEMAAALRAAPVGRSFVYARGPALDPAQPVVKLVKAEAEAGRAALFLNGRDAEGALRYSIRKLAAAAPAAAAPSAPAARLHAIAQDIYDLLVAAAEAKRPCPSNDALAEALGLADRHGARHRFKQLVEAGLIKVIEPARFGPRVIEITATGLRTLSSGGKVKG